MVECATGNEFIERVRMGRGCVSRRHSPVAMDDLYPVIRSPGMMGDGVEVRPLG